MTRTSGGVITCRGEISFSSVLLSFEKCITESKVIENERTPPHTPFHISVGPSIQYKFPNSNFILSIDA